VAKSTKRKAPARKASKKKTTTARKKTTKKRTAKKRIPKSQDILVSVFTPTDSIEHLQECYDSLCAQVYKNWEWILVPNGSLDKPSRIPAVIRRDSRVKVVYFPVDSTPGGNIGSLKKFATYQCRGQLYVELDHDDILTTDALFEIVKAYKKTGAGFLYSNFVSFREDHSSITYTEGNGWESYPVVFGGKQYLATRAFPPTADSIHRLYSTPNHVRAWSAEAYNSVGGHDPEYDVCDDFDIITRMYTEQIDFHHIDKCLYLYRQWDGSRSMTSRNAEIQQVEARIAHERTHAVAKESSRRRDLLSIELSVHKQENTLLYSNVTALEDNSVGWLRADDVLQFIPGTSVKEWFNVVWHKLAPGGWLSVSVPSTDGRGAFQVPTYKSFWNINSFMYLLNRDTAAILGGGDYKATYHMARRWDGYKDDYQSKINNLHTNVDFIAVKDSRRIAGAPLR
tara:strand:- start:10722 stop:12080 length:1359 start_codon:yes stop_codon:yes gene_type:complete